MPRGITEAIFAGFGKIFSSILLFITIVRSGVKKSAAIFKSFGGIVSIRAALLVSRHLLSFSISGGVTGLKKKFSFLKKFCPLNFFPMFYCGMVFVSI